MLILYSLCFVTQIVSFYNNEFCFLFSYQFALTKILRKIK